jgi:hypothetical protein
MHRKQLQKLQQTKLQNEKMPKSNRYSKRNFLTQFQNGHTIATVKHADACPRRNTSKYYFTVGFEDERLSGVAHASNPMN